MRVRWSYTPAVVVQVVADYETVAYVSCACPRVHSGVGDGRDCVRYRFHSDPAYNLWWETGPTEHGAQEEESASRDDPGSSLVLS